MSAFDKAIGLGSAIYVIDRMISEHLDAVKDLPASLEPFGVFATNGDRLQLLRTVKCALIAEAVRVAETARVTDGPVHEYHVWVCKDCCAQVDIGEPYPMCRNRDCPNGGVHYLEKPGGAKQIVTHAGPSPVTP